MSKKEKTGFRGGFVLGAVLGAIAGSIVGVLTSPQTEIDERERLDKEGKELIKSQKNSKAKTEPKKS